MNIFGKKSRTILVLDIRDVGIGGAVVSTNARGEKTILFSATEPIAIENAEKDIVAALGSAVGVLVKKISENPQSAKVETVCAMVHSPWIQSESQFFSSQLPHETVVTQKLLDKFISHSTKKEIAKGYVEIDKNITRTELNGYATEKPIGKRAQSIGSSAAQRPMITTTYWDHLRRNAP